MSRRKNKAGTLTEREMGSGELIQELRVHQIELEMQNDTLLASQMELETSRDRYQDLYDLAPVGYCAFSEKGLIMEANLTAATLLGTTRSRLIKQPISRFILKADQDSFYLYRKQLFETHSASSGQAGKSQECELRMVRPDGAIFWVHLDGTAAQGSDSAPVCRIMLSDISERKLAEQKIQSLNVDLEQLILIDDLTNLYNRRFFFQRGAEEVKRALRYKQPMALIMLDIDRFKIINDTVGHFAGDLALQQIARRLKRGLREIDILARLGGDEFAILLPNTPLQAAALLAERVRHSIASKNFDIPGNASPKIITISVGLAALTVDMASIDDLLKNADARMYLAKNSGGNCVSIYEKDLNDRQNQSKSKQDGCMASSPQDQGAAS